MSTCDDENYWDIFGHNARRKWATGEFHSEFFESGMYLSDNYLKRKATADSLPDT